MKPFLYPLSWALNILVILSGALSTKTFEVWCAMEISMVLFVVIILTGHKHYVSSKILLYFSFQALVSSVLIFSLFLSQSVNIVPLFCWSLMAKLGIGPSHHWFVAFAKPSEIFSNYMALCFVFVLQKVLPMAMLVMSGPDQMTSSLAAIVSSSVGLYFILGQQSLAGIMLGSSLMTFSFMVFSLTSGMVTMTTTLFLIYSMNTMAVLALSMKYSPSNSNAPASDLKTSSEKLSLLSLVLVMSGFPPSPLFVLKIMVVVYACNFYLSEGSSLASQPSMGMLLAASMFILFTSAVSIFSYMNLLYSFLFINSGESNTMFQWERFKSGERENVMYMAIFPATWLFGLFLVSVSA